MDIVKAYQRNIVTSKNFVFISICLVILLRIALFTNTDYFSQYPYITHSIFYNLTNPLWSQINSWLSFIIATVFALAISFYCAYLNLKYTVIRKKSYLVYSIVFLVLSSYPAFLVMNMQYIAICFFLLCIDILFSSYQSQQVAGKAYAIGFILAFSSLFSFYFLFYLILFWIGFVFMRSFTIKAFFASLLGVVCVYWLVLFYYLWQKDFDSYISLFTYVSTEFEFGDFFRLLSIDKYIVLGISILLLIFVVFYNQIYIYKDKIRVRAMIYFLNFLAISSILSCSLINLSPLDDLYIYAISYSLIIAHFFSVAEEKWEVYLFYLFLVLTIAGTAVISQF